MNFSEITYIKHLAQLGIHSIDGVNCCFPSSHDQAVKWTMVSAQFIRGGLSTRDVARSEAHG